MAKVISKKPSTQPVKAYISNALIESFVKKGNIAAFKILFYIAKSKLEIEGAIMALSIDIKKLCEFCNIDSKTLHRNIKQMTATSISISDNKSESYITVIPYARFDHNGGLEIKMFKEVLELIQRTKNQFTVIDTAQIVKLSSKHSIRMTMLLEHIAGFDEHIAKRKYYTLEELNLMFGTNYKRLKQFEVEILTKTKEELDSSSKLSFEYTIKYDKESATIGRAKAVGITIDVITRQSHQPSLF